MKSITLEIPVSEINGDLKYKEFIKFEEGGNPVVFRSTVSDTVAFILVHGNKDGEVEVGGHLLTLEEILTKSDTLLNRLKDKGITELQTISCYGGYQKEAVVEGIVIKSLHPFKKTIRTKAFRTMDDETILEVQIEKE